MLAVYFISDKQVKPDLQQEAGYVSSLLYRMRFSQERAERLEVEGDPFPKLIACWAEGSSPQVWIFVGTVPILLISA